MRWMWGVSLLALAGCDDVRAVSIWGNIAFRYVIDPGTGNSALLRGPVTVDGSCLYVDDQIVVWRGDHLDDLRFAIDEGLNNGRFVEISIGGGERIASSPTIESRCNVRSGLFNAGLEPLEYAFFGPRPITEEKDREAEN